MDDAPPRRSTLKPKGRAGRRTQAEQAKTREDYLKQTKEQQEEFAQQELRRVEEERRRQRLEQFKNQRGGRGRGRGGYMGESDRTPAGPFSAGSVVTADQKRSFPRPWAPSKRGRSGQAKTFNVIKREGDNENDSTDAGISKAEESDDSGFSNESDDVGRINVDSLDLSRGPDSDGVREIPLIDLINPPLRAARVSHRDRAVPIIAAGAYIKKQETDDDEVMEDLPAASGKAKQRSKATKATQETRPKRRWKGVYEDDDDVLVQDSSEYETSPTSKRPSSIRPQTGRQSPTKSRSRQHQFGQPPPGFRTDEDLEEWHRYQKDRQQIVTELGPPATGLDGPDAAPNSNRQDRIYLFQLPPVLPNLLDPTKSVTEESTSTTAAAKTLASSSRPAGETTASDQVDVKEEEVVEVKNEPESKPTLFFDRPKHLPSLQSGKVGKLRVYKSGKATLDWGGVDLSLRVGIMPQFLQTGVLLQMNPGMDSASANKATNAIVGEAFPFGQVRGKFVATPDWEKIVNG